MRVCILTNNTRTDNGWGRFAHEFILALRREGIDVVVLSEEPGSFPDEHVILDQSLRFSLRSFWHTLFHLPLLFRNALRVRRYLCGVGIVHALDGYPYGVIASLALRGSATPLVITLQGTYSVAVFRHAIERKLLTGALYRASQVVCISSYTAAEIQKYLPGLASEIVGHGTASFWLTAPVSTMPLPIPCPYILSVGTIKPHKGYRVGLEAFARARKKFPKLSYAIVGYQGHLHFAEIKHLAKKLGVQNSVCFFTDLTEMELLRLYDHAAFFVLTPISTRGSIEGFGLVYREAGARGLAVIGSKNCGADDAVQDGVTGILCAQGDVNAVTEAIEKLINNETLRKGMGEAGQKLARGETWDVVAKKYSDIYQVIRRTIN